MIEIAACPDCGRIIPADRYACFCCGWEADDLPTD